MPPTARLQIIMDGNARWAARRGRKAQFGHESGVGPLKESVRCCCAWGIKALTVRNCVRLLSLPTSPHAACAPWKCGRGLTGAFLMPDSRRRCMPFLLRTGDVTPTRCSSYCGSWPRCCSVRPRSSLPKASGCASLATSTGCRRFCRMRSRGGSKWVTDTAHSLLPQHASCFLLSSNFPRTPKAVHSLFGPPTRSRWSQINEFQRRLNLPIPLLPLSSEPQTPRPPPCSFRCAGLETRHPAAPDCTCQ